jgi:hypothetical protein
LLVESKEQTYQFEANKIYEEDQAKKEAKRLHDLKFQKRREPIIKKANQPEVVSEPPPLDPKMLQTYNNRTRVVDMIVGNKPPSKDQNDRSSTISTFHLQEQAKSIQDLHVQSGITLTQSVKDDWGQEKIKKQRGQPWQPEGSETRITRADYDRITSAGNSFSVQDGQVREIQVSSARLNSSASPETHLDPEMSRDLPRLQDRRISNTRQVAQKGFKSLIDNSSHQFMTLNKTSMPLHQESVFSSQTVTTFGSPFARQNKV